MTPVEQFCVECNASLGTYEPLTEEEISRDNVVPLCMKCYCTHYRCLKLREWKAMIESDRAVFGKDT